MRLSPTLSAAAFASVLMTAAAAQAAPPAAPAAAPTAPAAAARPAIVPATNVSDAEVASYAKAIVKVSALSRALNGAQATDAQRAEMMAAVTSNGLTIARFEAIGAATGADAVLKARVIVAATPNSPAGSVGAGVTDAEAAQFARAIIAVQGLNPANPPTPEQETAEKAAIVATGMTLDRFQAIIVAANTDQHLHARIALAAVKMGRG